MKKTTYVFIALVAAFLFLNGIAIQAQTPVNQWGKTAQGGAWPVLNDAATPAGEAGLGNDAVPTGWATIRGGFDPVQATTEKAVIVRGKMELLGGGGGSAYTHMRYALTFNDSLNLNYQNTDSAKWVESGKLNHYGYEFCPRTGTGIMANGSGYVGTVWQVKNGSWSSNWSNGGKTISALKQAPTDAEMVAGEYNWAISVQPLADGTNEVRWSLVEKDNKYWFAGIAIDSAAVSTQFNGVCFGFNNDSKTTKVNFMEVQIDLGAPIDIPEKPWEALYVKEWGKTVQGTAWPILNDAGYFDGDAGIGGGARPTGWSTIRGGFDPVQATAEKAVIVRGKLELVGGGGGSGYTHLRYALTFKDSLTLNYQNTDSAMWANEGKLNHYGYEFCPITGTGIMSNGAWGVGTVGVVKNGNWHSTNSNGGKAISAQKQVPTNAEMVAGEYNWAISVQPLADGTNEVRWSLVEKDNKYWFAGIAIDSSAVIAKFNGICFGFNSDQIATQVNFMEVQIDLGAPIDIPEKPWEAIYVNQWGFIGGRIGGWKFTPGDFDGDATISGTAPPTGWSALRGEFKETVAPTTAMAMVVTGKIEFVGGGFEAWSSLRYGVFYSDSAGTLNTTSVDSTRWTGTENNNYGYLFLPQSGANPAVSWQGIGQTGTYGAVVNRPWISTNGANDYVLGSNLHEGAAVAGAGVYDFAMSFAPKEDGTMEVRFSIEKADKSYKWAGIAIDNHSPLATKKFNCVAFALNSGTTTTAMKLQEVKIDLGDQIDVTTGVGELADVSIPTVYALSQSYPNPFNPSTTIGFALPQSSNVRLVVYDLMGRVVAELANGHFNAGYYKVTFDARNLASGVYFYQLKAGDFTSVRKVSFSK